MLNLVFEIILISVLLLTFVQDVRHRAIHILLPLAIAVIGLYFFYEGEQIYMTLVHNFFFLLCIFVGLYLYLLAKYRSKISLLTSIGLGDILFFIAVIPYFSTTNYILFFSTGMLFSILVFTIIKIVSKSELVPLAGLLALYMVLLKGVSHWMDLNFYNNNFL
nr:hypothetical protein [Allomuricauda sp.]